MKRNRGKAERAKKEDERERLSAGCEGGIETKMSGPEVSCTSQVEFSGEQAAARSWRRRDERERSASRARRRDEETIRTEERLREYSQVPLEPVGPLVVEQSPFISRRRRRPERTRKRAWRV